MVDLKSEDDVKAWQKTRPITTRKLDSIVLASRAALRVLPNTFSESFSAEKWVLSLILSTFRSCAAARLFALFPNLTVQNAALEAAYDNGPTAPYSAARFAARSAYSVAGSVGTNKSSVLAVDSVVTSVESISQHTIAITVSAPLHAASAARDAAWQAINSDATLVEEWGAREAMLKPVPFLAWSDNPFESHAANWVYLKAHLLRQKDGDWQVWIDWYERIVTGKSAPLAVEEAYVFLDDPKLWEKGHKTANAAIKKKLEEVGPPKTPEEISGTTIDATPYGFELLGSTVPNQERSDPTQISLHASILRRIKRINTSVTSLDNTQKTLKDEYLDFASFISNDVADIDVATVWSCGAGLTDMVGRVERQFEKATKDDNRTKLAELPSEDMVSQLVSLTRDYAAFIMGFKQAQELALKAAEISKLDLSKADQASQIFNVLEPMLKVKNLLAENAGRLFSSLSRATDKVDDATVALLGAGVSNTRNALVGFGRAVQKHPILATTILVAGSPLDVAMKLSGDPNWETIRAAMLFLSENTDVLYAFANHDPVMRRWLEWLIQEIKKVEPRII
jgi:hypothetical protein